jgi:hypothetical protein
MRLYKMLIVKDLCKVAGVLVKWSKTPRITPANQQ